MAINQKGFTYDALLLAKDAGAITSSAAAQVAAADKRIDLGAARVDLRFIAQVSAIDVTTGDEFYTLRVQLSNSATFASTVNTAASIELGGATPTGNSSASAVGRYEIGFSNELNGTVFRYARLFTVCAGTTPSINYVGYFVRES